MLDKSRDIDGNGLTGIKISRKQQQMANARANGKSLKEIAVIHYPGATEASGVVQVSRQMNLPHVAKYLEQSKLMALKEHNITWSRIIKPISDALQAGDKWTETDEETGEITQRERIDHATRLRAAKQASDLLVVKDEIDPASVERLKLPSNIDEIQLVRLLKNSRSI